MPDDMGYEQYKLKNSYAADPRELDRLRQLGTGTKQEQAYALKAAAEQFEGMLMKYWVDGMRQSNDALNPDSPLHSKYSTFFEDMLATEQVQQSVACRGSVSKNSITYLIARQFSKPLGDAGRELLEELTGGSSRAPSDETRLPGSYVRPSFSAFTRRDRNPISRLAGTVSAVNEAETPREFADNEDFVAKLMPYARQAAGEAGFNPLILVTQAALETGWGRHVPDNNNFFGIKAGKAWKGESTELASDEYRDGRMCREVSRFRKYTGVLESMRDYIDFIFSNPRYEKAAAKSFSPDEYFEEIQRAGYATDPDYALKLKNISRKIAFMAYK